MQSLDKVLINTILLLLTIKTWTYLTETMSFTYRGKYIMN